MRKLIPELIGVGQLQRQTAQAIRKVSQEQQEAFIVAHNKPQAVLLSLSRYRELKALEEAKEREEAEVLEVVARADAEFEGGKTVTKKSLRNLL